jgi:hypothetical protein
VVAIHDGSVSANGPHAELVATHQSYRETVLA